MTDVMTTARKVFARWFRRDPDALSREAYARWQADVRARKQAARSRHGRIRDLERRQTEALHAALAANRQQGN